MSTHPIFYLLSSENYALRAARSCTEARPLPGRHTGGSYVHVKIEPEIIGHQFGLGGRDIHHVVLAPRHAGVTLMPLSESPAAVHVALLLIPFDQALQNVTSDDLRLLGWGEVYATLDE